MELFLILLTFIKGLATSLGVGSSTIAIANFFVAIKDGSIGPEERGIMQVTYVVLRVAMGLILLSTVLLLGIQSLEVGTGVFTAYAIAEIVLIFVLYLNAILMTKKLMPSKFGPAIQAGTWYTLATVVLFLPQFNTPLTVTTFVVVYVGVVLVAIALVNGIMKLLRTQQQKPTASP